MHLMWGMMNTLQLIGILLEFDLLFPSNVYLYFFYIKQFLSMKAEFINKLFDTLFDQADDLSDLATFIAAVISILVLMIIVGFANILAGKVGIIRKIVDSVRNKLFYNSILRALIQSYLKSTLIAFKGAKTYSFSSFVPLILAWTFPIYVAIFLHYKRSNLSRPEVRLRFDSLYANLKILPKPLLMPLLFLFRRFIYSILAVFSTNYLAL